MSKIRGTDTRPELEVRRQLNRAGVKNYRVKSNLPGKPDLIFKKERLVVFIDGCFWHMCPVDFKSPQTRKTFWIRKLRGNVKRDSLVTDLLQKMGWRVERFWEHEVKASPDGVANQIRIALEGRP